MTTATERFLRYVTFDTQSEEDSNTIPSTAKQKELGRALAAELNGLGLAGAEMDEKGYVYAFLPATPGRENDPVIALLAHMDTASGASGADVKASIVHYTGGDLVLNREKGIALDPATFPDLLDQVGQDLIVTDGTTLLGADDKAGVAEIVTALAFLQAHPEQSHGRVAVCITPDEEIGRGADYVDLDKLGADFGYTVDGGPLGSLEYENFNAASAEIAIQGVNIHPGDAKGKMKNAALIAAELVALVPPAESPAHTAGYEGFYHLCALTGDESSAALSWLIRDHDRESFQKRKDTMTAICSFLNRKYGEGTVKLTLTDSYYNMREKVEPHPEILDRARAAFRAAGVEPRDVPIRGGTDGAKLSFLGLPCPNLSTGGYHFHGVHEYIPVSALETMARVLVYLIAEEG
jgi:tripeptide aminopeptidase